MITSEVFLLEENNKNNKDKHISKSASVLITNYELCVKGLLQRRDCNVFTKVYFKKLHDYANAIEIIH